jgi:spore coat-associated protein N
MTASKMNRKVLVPLATLVAAGAVTVGSGATFTSTTDNTTSSVTAGRLEHTNSKNNAAVFTINKIKPGDVVNGKLTITNSGNLPATFTLREPASTNNFGAPAVGAANYLHLKITDDTASTTVFDGDFGALGNAELKSLGQIDPGLAHTYTFAVSLDAAASNSQQGLTAGAEYQWVSTQLAGETTEQ